ncbi:hypothetical protein EPO34_01365 [Patescibacteria group bacterium]|nr:MAG: hypothetical protein EPO34_01365 [Patescibacteria group bacterium]
MSYDLKRDPLTVTTIHAVLGGLIGMVCGILFLYLIIGLASVLPGGEPGVEGLPVQIAMIGGSVLGAILGGMVGLRKS